MKKLEVNNLTVSFRSQGGMVRAVRDISFSLNKGETLAIVGESGSGKSVTSKAIMGILAGNSVVDGGEIIYDGQDLLKITEEDFHKLRGDKIAMIFQDPMSSLNPIMKIGSQLTEAMLLKNSASKRRAREDFNSKLALINSYMDAVNGDKIGNKNKCNTFDKFAIESIDLEGKYNACSRQALELADDIEKFLSLLGKNATIDSTKIVKRVIKQLPLTFHPNVIDSSSVSGVLADLKLIDSGKGDGVDLFSLLTSLHKQLTECQNNVKPNYFTLGYYTLTNGQDKTIADMPLSELNAMTEQYLNEHFLDEFKGEVAKALDLSFNSSLELKRNLLATTEEALEFFRNDELNAKECKAMADALADLVEKAIDRLAINKNSVLYTFESSLNKSIKQYFDGIKHNPLAVAKYNKQLKLWNKLDAKGKTPDWQVIPANVVDLTLAKQNIRNVLHRLRGDIRLQLQKADEFDAMRETNQLIDYLKEKASVAVYTVTPKMAKAKALRLLEEVGIADPQARYNQFPFEFSGGMRQRIVIAIALAANPDILICDEPTTALDVTIQSQILELINKLKRERELTVIFITHDLGVVANMADQIAVMYAGKIVEEGSCEEIFYDPRHPYTWALLASMPDLDTTQKLEAIPGTPPNMIYPPVGDAFADRNKYALEIDFLEQPPMFEVSPTHRAATWLLHPDAPKIDPPAIVVDRIKRSKLATKEV